ncbi:MarR family transcriptional regulator [candidate division WWE3 bacterium]|uniref:MarR family transcriptional regulator n=1 Tax=candidate division WWE3 bacterium TaxID=2053526 RepID=A0A3A4ZJ43_UNCKA|nr:MAG: MarR family transcriptional regulator [candidate division WWE3 bacterium]
MRDRIIDYLSQHPGGIDDDQLALVLGLKHRQQANSRCRRLMLEGLVDRHTVGGKIQNFWLGSFSRMSPSTKPQSATLDHPQRLLAPLTLDEHWSWEGNVQGMVVKFLTKQGYSIIRAADTRSKEHGKDIEATKDSRTLWVTVKGFPKGTPKTHPSTQAGHWFKGALFEIVAWRGESEFAKLAIALPDYPRYRKLAAKITWLQPVTRFSYYWVREDGIVDVDDWRG